MKKLVGISSDILVWVSSFTFLSDFVILDYEVPITLKRLFLRIGHALVAMETRQIMIHTINEQITLICVRLLNIQKICL